MSGGETYQQVREIITDILDQPDLDIVAETSAVSVDGWDSFNQINIIVALEARFGIKFNTAEIEHLRDVGELVNLVDRKLEAKNSAG
jgi:acyl carrier protein